MYPPPKSIPIQIEANQCWRRVPSQPDKCSLQPTPDVSVTSLTFSQVTSAQGERNIQLALKFYF